MAPFEALYGRPCRSPVCWPETGDGLFLEPDLIREASGKIKLIRKRMKDAQSRQKCYADIRHKELEFAVGDDVFVKVSPMRGVMRFGKAGKLAPRFVGPFPIIGRIGKLAYRVELPEKLAAVHNVSHVSHLRKCVRDARIVIEPSVFEDLEVEPDLTVVRRPTRIVDRDAKSLRNKTVTIVKVQWSNNVNDCTWEPEDKIRRIYPEFFV